uniref:Pco110570 n=1 Tax=Arundo donax TaxID=35708 RepID=A0A0A9E915_ARUDO
MHPECINHISPDIVAVEAVDEDVPAKVEEVDGRRRHRHRRPPACPPPLSRRWFHGAPPGTARGR